MLEPNLAAPRVPRWPVFTMDLHVEMGWEADELVGARLTTVIPPEHRLAHLAGFARYQATGETRLLGSTIEVPVLRADGSAITLTSRLEAHATASGSRVFHAELTPSNA